MPSPTLREWRDLQQTKPQEHPLRQQLRAEFHRAALDMAQVTGIPEWDLLGTYLNGLIEQLERDNAQLRRALEHETLVDPLEVSRLRQQIVGNNIRIETLRQVMAFPQTVQARARDLDEQQEQTNG